MQLVTRDLAVQEAFNSTHVALPVQCGFEDFMRVGQLLWLVRLDKKGGKGREGETVKVVYLHSYAVAIEPFSYPSILFW